MRPLSLVSGASGDGVAAVDVLEPIAIVGLATRFSQDATTTEDLWQLLLEARSTWSSIPKERFNADAFYHPDPEHGGTFHVQGGHFLTEDPAFFDSSFFNITKNELLTLDPQQRLVMENVYHALENAGIALESAVGSNTSVFVSGFNHDYLGILNSDPETSVKYKPTGVTNASLSNRVSWFFNFKGPSMTVDTACSSSLVGLHLAVQSLRARETNMAVVSGVSILENPVETIGMSHHGLLGAQGRCFSFDSRAEGYARGEGVGSVVLKPLHAAVRDGDTIRAIIRETGVNQDGRTPGMTVPSADAQERLIREVYWRAGLPLEQTRFVEAHGTGTSTGDPIEAEALSRAFKCRNDAPIYVGTIKSTIGHLEGGSGVASIIKSILVLESGIIPANHDFQQVNPKIPAEDWNITFPTKNIPWPSKGLRRVSVNSFGIGGTNAHCVLDDAYHYLKERHITASHHTTPAVPRAASILNRVSSRPRYETDQSDSHSDSADDSVHSSSGFVFVDTPTSETSCSCPAFGPTDYSNLIDVPQMFLLSAFDEDGVKRNGSAYASYLNDRLAHPGPNDQLLDDLSFTLSKHRSMLPWKAVVTASTAKQLVWNLDESKFFKTTRTTEAPELSFVFTGQGAQYQAMGRALMVYPVFRDSLGDASEYIRRLGSPWSLIDELLTEGKSTRVNLPEIAHPVCTALQVALVDLLASWGIVPRYVTGHSSGEIAAAYCAGKLSREAAWKVSYFRGYVSSKQTTANGAMMAVGLNESQLEQYLNSVREGLTGELIIACYNSPRNNTVSGDESMIDALKKLLDADGIFARKLNVQNAYHSAHMAAIATDYLELMGTLAPGRRLAAPHVVHMFSTVTGEEIKDEHIQGQYWVDNMVSPVRFTDALGLMYTRANSDAPDAGIPHIVEIGPHSTLQSAIKETLGLTKDETGAKYFALLKRNDDTLNTLLNTVGSIAVNGYPLDLHIINIASRSQKRRPPRLLVDLPPYSFKHSEKVLYESRLSRNLRNRKVPRHDLFGAPVPDWDASLPRWRHFVRLNENPWLRDHMVTGNYVYPGVGFLVMAIEASRQLAGDDKLSGFQIRQVSIKRALIVPETEKGIEVCLSMTTEEPSSETRPWRRFHIRSYNESSDSWTEHCTGCIAVEHAKGLDPVDHGREAKTEAQSRENDLQRARNTCSLPINFRTIYNKLQREGLNFGALFQNLSDVHASGTKKGIMTGMVTTPDIAKSMPKQYIHPHLIHPATMDSMIHMMIAAVIDFDGSSSLLTIRLPTFIREMWVSADLDPTPHCRFTGHASVSIAAAGKFHGQIQVFDAVSNAHRIRMDGIELTPLESGSEENHNRELCTLIDWRPDAQFLNSKAACDLVSLDDANQDQDRQWVQRLQLVTMLYVVDAMDELKDLNIMALDLHLRRFYEWMKHMREKLFSDAIIHLPYSMFQEVSHDPSLKRSICEETESHSAEGAITVRMGRNIIAVMRNAVDPLHLMFGQDNIMEEVYKEGLHLYNLPQYLHNHLSLLRHHHSSLNILEVGGGTGSFTAKIFDVLSAESDPSKGSIESYTFTDISSGFFSKAKEKFNSWSNIMKFQSLDIGRDPADQGLQVGTYDLIFAGNVIHATPDLNTALRNLRSLLRPGGQLIMQEGIRQDFLWYPLVFGQLPGWWLGNEPSRKWCPYIPTSEWNKLLSESGFSGVDIEYPSSADEDLTWQSILVSTAVAPWISTARSIFILTSGSPATVDAVTALQETLQQKEASYNVAVVGPTELDRITGSDSLCISLIDLETPFLADIKQEEFYALRTVLMECPNILWLIPDPAIQPLTSMSMGLLRTIRSERDADGCNIVTFDIGNPTGLGGINMSTLIGTILEHQFLSRAEIDRHAEYRLRNGIIEVARLREWQESDSFLSMQSSNVAPELKRLGDVGRPVQLSFSKTKTDELHWLADPSIENPLGDTDIEVEIRAVGLNSDVHDSSPSVEASGVVKSIGPAVEGFVPGDNVVFLTCDEHKSSFRTLARLDQSLAVKIPLGMSFWEAAGLPSAYVTVLYGLGEVARLCQDDRILIHDGASALGQAAVQYAKMIGAKVYSTVSTTEDREFLVSEHGISEDHIFSNIDFSFARGIMRCTKGSGVDVVFDSLSTEALQESLACVAPFGRLVHVSCNKGQDNTMLDFSLLQQNVTMTTVDIPSLVRCRPKLLKRLVVEMLELHAKGNIGGVLPLTVMDLAQIDEGVRALKIREKRVGKIVFKYDPSDLIPVTPYIPSPYQFDGGASYILAGGLGGLGRSLARWMASHGARSLIFLSRSARITEPVREMLGYLKSIGCNAHIFTCDVADAHRVKAVIEECAASLPPIKGCIQGSMSLRDGAFASMSVSDWQAAITPKVQGSWNLHELLPTDIDFFVMLSSVAGIFGNRGQANYAAGNAFQDALAAYRMRRGMNTYSIDLGSVSSVGWVAENRNSMRTHTATLFELLREDEVHGAIEFLIDPRYPKANHRGSDPQSQLVLGLPTAAMCRQNGIPPPAYLNYSLFTHQRNTATAKVTETSDQKSVSTAALLSTTSSVEAAISVVSNGIVERLSSLLLIPASDIDVHRFGFGVIDSLVAMEFRSWIVKELQAEVSLLDIMGAQNIRSLSEKIAQTTRLLRGDAT
ncbi:Acyl transferase/acyl hydrolase/lysophospholipase [Penicillium canariense]|uniref:Acyl transferase/acyl hydrolase/lysophospholipase n=1 Tax=Penicillium canariense TaxID=189055 RepID=A0A9W9LDY7_9EURO|nr:Acyl transferase/acyl hydrolase/lysophospholipase [Penicillium canariense]KAJ5151089.1 Acyl transferase/acyl hydrolase/lysophospholipase [Penicillium canariense]